MKVVIAGSRRISGVDADSFVTEAVHGSGWLGRITEVVSGCARGVDDAGMRWAAYMGFPVKRFPADWRKHDRAAGPVRNRQMAEYADALIAIWNGESPGTRNMIEEMRARGKPVYVHRVER
jgi:hypothetical protein